MSVFESHGTAGVVKDGIDPPEFPVVVRGYDRQRVNAYLQSMVSRLSAEHDRAVQAEQAATNNQPPTFEHLGAEAMKVLELASGSAELLVAQARRRGETIVEDAEGQAADLFEETKQRAERLHAAARGTLTEAANERDRILAEANDLASQIRTQAADDAKAMLEEAQAASQRMWEKVRDECSAMQAETERLQALHDRTMEHLSRVRIGLDSLLAGPPEDESNALSVRDTGGDSDLEATAQTGAESDPPAASGEPAELDAAAADQPESDQEDDPEPARPVTTPASAQQSGGELSSGGSRGVGKPE
jgi:cell division septum initiation protein DivIVA